MIHLQIAVSRCEIPLQPYVHKATPLVDMSHMQDHKTNAQVYQNIQPVSGRLHSKRLKFDSNSATRSQVGKLQ